MRIRNRIFSGIMALILTGSTLLSATQPVMASGYEDPVLTDTESQEKSIDDLLREASEFEGDEDAYDRSGYSSDEDITDDSGAGDAWTEEPQETKVLYAFEADAVVDGLKIHVEAPEGVFPEGCTLKAEPAQYVTDEVENTAVEFALDISIMDAYGQEVEPDTAYGQVSVTFESELIANDNLTTDVCHVVNGVEQEMALTVEDGTATTETDSFSVYIVRFTYGTLEYILEGGGSIAISDILETVGLTGTLEGAVSSAPDLFSVDTANWTVKALRAFTTRETLTVTLDGLDYVINVTDDGAEAGQYAVLYDDGTLVFQNDNATDASYGTAVQVIDLSDDIMAWSAACGEDVKNVKFRETFTPEDTLTFTVDDAPNLEKAELANLDMSVVKDMSLMFADSPIKEVDMTGFDASQVTTTEYMFAGCTELASIDMSNMHFNNLEYADYMFDGCSGLKDVNFSGFDAPKLIGVYDMFSGCSSIETLDFSDMRCPYVPLGDMKLSSSKKYKTVSFRNAEVFTKNPYGLYGSTAGIDSMFANCPDLTSVDFYNCNLGYTSQMNSLFLNCPKLETVIMQGMKAPSLTQMNQAFMNCPSLKSANFKGATFNSLTSMNGLYSNCTGLENATFEGASFPRLTNINGCFSGCTSLKSVSFKDTSMPALTDLTYLFNTAPTALENITFKGADLSSLRSMNALLKGASKLKYLDMSDLYVPELTGMASMCQNCTSLERASFEGMYAPKLNNVSNIFSGDSNLKYVSFAGADMSSPSLTNIPLFTGDNSSLVTVDFSNAKLSSVQYLNSIGLSGKPNLKTVLFDGADLSSVMYMPALFSGDSNLETVSFSGARTGNITVIDNMFSGCSKLHDFDLTDLDLTNLTSMSGAFNSCLMLKTIDCSTVGDNLRDMSTAFMSCRSLTSVVLPDGTSDVNMNRTFNGANNLQRIYSPSAAPRFNTSYTSSLPVKEWKHEETQEAISDFWNDTETSLTGWFIRGDVTELNKDNIDEIDYDPDTKTIYMYITSDKEQVPCSVTLPGLASALDLNPNLVNKNAALKELLESSFDTEELKLTLRTRTYSDIMSCADAPQVIWTFDVPKTNTSVIRFYIYENDTDTLAGYIENSPDALDVFTQYDASGNAVRTIEPNARMTYADMGYAFPEDVPEGTNSAQIYGKYFTRNELESEVYQEYEKYISYNPEMNNYEALIAPGKYRIEMSYPEYEDILLTPAGTQESEPDGDGNTHITMYSCQTDLEEGDSREVRASLFNVIKRDPVASSDSYADAYNTFAKTSAVNGSTVGGAVFALQSLMTGLIYQATAGLITYQSMLTNAFPAYSPALYEMFKVWEIQAPEGYYLSTETVTFALWAEHMEYAGQVQGVNTYIDGISITKDIINESPCATCCCYISGYDYTVIYDCLCGTFGSSKCKNCGVGVEGIDTPTGKQYTISNIPFPTLSILKKDAGGNKISGAVMQLLDKETGEPVGEWTTSDDPEAYVYRFNTGDNVVIPYGESKMFTVHEKTAPEGYELAEDVDVTVSYDSGDLSVTMTDPFSTHDIIISKADVLGEEVEGAQLSITGTELYSTTPITPITWTSGTEPYTAQIKPGTYTLHEVREPRGYMYQRAADIEFTVGTDGTVTVNNETVDKVTMVDRYYDQYVIFKKVDGDGNFVPGATLQVTGRELGATEDIEPQTFEATREVWDYGGGDVYIQYCYILLFPGTYTVEEVGVPEGYEKADNITFVVDKYGDVYVDGVKVDEATVTVVNKKLASIQLTKYNADKTEALGGAEFDVYKGTAGTAGDVFKHFAVNADGTSDVIEGFEAGTYYIVETKAPVGHALNATPLEFTITEEMYGTTVQLEMTDDELLVLPEAGGHGSTNLYIPAFAITLLFMALAYMAKRKLRGMA